MFTKTAMTSAVPRSVGYSTIRRWIEKLGFVGDVIPGTTRCWGVHNHHISCVNWAIVVVCVDKEWSRASRMPLYGEIVVDGRGGHIAPAAVQNTGRIEPVFNGRIFPIKRYKCHLRSMLVQFKSNLKITNGKFYPKICGQWVFT